MIHQKELESYTGKNIIIEISNQTHHIGRLVIVAMDYIALEPPCKTIKIPSSCKAVTEVNHHIPINEILGYKTA